MERFWSKVDKSPGQGPEGTCWIWTTSSRGYGYGAFKYEGKCIDAHRISYMLNNVGCVLTSKDFICHKCDNPPCVNPAHLFKGNAQDNARDMVSKNRDFRPDNRIKCEEGTSWCHRCKSFKPITDFTKNKSKLRGVEDECKTCKSIRNKKRNRKKNTIDTVEYNVVK